MGQGFFVKHFDSTRWLVCVCVGRKQRQRCELWLALYASRSWRGQHSLCSMHTGLHSLLAGLLDIPMLGAHQHTSSVGAIVFCTMLHLPRTMTVTMHPGSPTCTA